MDTKDYYLCCSLLDILCINALIAPNVILYEFFCDMWVVITSLIAIFSAFKASVLAYTTDFSKLLPV
jgi:hypothetical protein